MPRTSQPRFGPLPSEKLPDDLLTDTEEDMDKIAAELRQADVSIRKELVYPENSPVATHGIQRKSHITEEEWMELGFVPNHSLRPDPKDENDNVMHTPPDMHADTQEDSPEQLIEIPDETFGEVPDDSQPGGNDSPPGITADVTDEIPARDHDMLGGSEKVGPSGSSGDSPAPEPKSKPKSKTWEQILKHRKSSLSWHTKWVQKGVPRVAKEKTKESVKAKAKAKAAPASVDPNSAPVQSLSKARDLFITKWINESGMPKSLERRKAACDAWMNSSLRAQLMASRTGTQN